MKRLLILLSIVAAAAPAPAWGPKTELAIVSTAAQVLSKQHNLPLRRVEKEIREGAALSTEELNLMHPEAQVNPARAVENEMALLRAVDADRLSAYFGFRMGALGKLTANLTAPLHEAPQTYANLYYADVDKQIERVNLRPAARQFVDPAPYFSLRMREAAVNDELIVSEYQGGVGFTGSAQSSFAEAASRSVNAVADVWHTVLTGTALPGRVSEEQLREYVVTAMSFYARRSNTGELDQAAERLSGMVPITADLAARIGDAFFEAGAFDRAIKWYQQVVERDPNRRDVAQKISQYYVEQGELAMEKRRLEDARDAFQAAVSANALDPEAEGLRLRAEEMISDRDQRQADSQAALNAAQDTVARAEQEALNRRYSEAAALLREAQVFFQGVSDEFPLEYQKAQQGLTQVEIQIAEMRDELVANAQSFSGSGYTNDTRELARTRASGLDELALRALIQQEFEEQVAVLQTELEQEIARD